MYATISVFRRSFKQQNGINWHFMKQLERYKLRKNTEIVKALTKSIKQQHERVAQRRNRFRDEYIYLCAIRPYYFDLQKKGISFKSDIEKHIKLDGDWEEEVKDDLNNYVQMIMDFATNSGKTNYIEARAEEYDRIDMIHHKVEKEKKEASKARQLERRLDKLNKYVSSYYNRQVKHNVFMDLVTNHYKYNPSYKSCKIIVALSKINGHETIVYYSGQDVSEFASDASLFFDDDEAILQECIKECNEMENVLCTMTMQLL